MFPGVDRFTLILTSLDAGFGERLSELIAPAFVAATDEFTAFAKKLRGVTTTTLPQLLHHKDKVIEALLERLDHATTLSLQPFLE